MNHTVEKTIEILKLISGHNEGLALSQIVKELGLPKSTVFGIVHTLVERGMLTSGGTGQPVYRLGVESLKLGLSYLNGVSVDTVVRPVLSTLCQEANETVFMSVRSGKSDVVYVMKYLSDREFQTSYSVGAVRPMMSIAMGKAILATLPEQEVREILTPEQLACSNRADLCDVPSVLAFLRESRRLGYILDETSENQYFAAAVAAPLRDVSLAVVGAISIVIMHRPDDAAHLHAMGNAVRAAALEISHGLGFQSDDLFG